MPKISIIVEYGFVDGDSFIKQYDFTDVAPAFTAYVNMISIVASERYIVKGTLTMLVNGRELLSSVFDFANISASADER